MGTSKITGSKLCVICAGESYKHEHGRETVVYLIDSKLLTGGDGDQPIEPTVRLRWDTFNEPAVCVLGSKVYIFQGGIMKDEPYLDIKEVYMCDLPQEASNLTLEKADVQESGSGINHQKFHPIAIATMDGKILVFSSSLSVSTSLYRDFELYDPMTQTCYVLPNLPVEHTRLSSSIAILSYTFLKNNVFYLNSDVGDFTLHLKRKPENSFWRRNGYSGYNFLSGNRTPVVIERRICLLPDYIAYIPKCDEMPDENDNLYYKYPSPPPDNSTHENAHNSMTLLNKGKDDFSVCILQVRTNDFAGDFELMYPELMMHTYSTTQLRACMNVLSENRNKKLMKEPVRDSKFELFELPNTSKLSSFKFRVMEQFSTFYFMSFRKTENC